MKHLEAFLAMEGMLEERPVEAVRLATSALLAISFMRSETPFKTKKGLPVYEHKIPLEPYSANLRVKPHPSDFLSLEKPEERVLAADLPASLTYFYRSYLGASFSFERDTGIVSVEFGKGSYFSSTGSASATEQGICSIRNIWQDLHAPTIMYVQQVANQLG